jgi:hypothetical protein
VRIGKNVPEARPLLWKLLQSGEDRTSFYALGALGNIGFLPEDIPNLAALIPGQTEPLLIRYLPEQIARAIKQDPEAMKAYLEALRKALFRGHLILHLISHFVKMAHLGIKCETKSRCLTFSDWLYLGPVEALLQAEDPAVRFSGPQKPSPEGQ